ncbi:MAG: hypothetical protein ABSD27_14965 [Bryobacteraceae bacterium]|jgi:hypothetical protein
MKSFLALGLTLVVSGCAFAQWHAARGAAQAPRGSAALQGDGVPISTYGSPSGFGNVLFPGTGTAPPAGDWSSSVPAGFGDWLDVFAGWRDGDAGRFRRHFSHRSAYGYPLAWPVMVGGLYYDPSYADQQPPNITIVMPPQPSSPPLTINQSFPPGSSKDMQHGPGAADASASSDRQDQPEASPAQEERALLFVALKDNSVYTAVAYWVEDGTLYYTTPQDHHNQVSLDLVDRERTARLNAGSDGGLRLPPR